MRRASYLIAILALAFCAGASAANAASLQNIGIAREGDSIVVTIATSTACEYNTFLTDDRPERIVIDLMGIENKFERMQFTDLPLNSIRSIRTSQYKLAPDLQSRVVLDIERPVEFQSYSDGSNIIVKFPAFTDEVAFANWGYPDIVNSNVAVSDPVSQPAAEPEEIEPVQSSEEEVADAAETPIEQAASEQPMEEAVEETVQQVAEEAVEETVQQVTEEAVEETVQQAAEEAVEETVQQTMEEAVEETVVAAVEETVELAVEEAVEETVVAEMEETAEAELESLAEQVEEDVVETSDEQVSEPVPVEKEIVPTPLTVTTAPSTNPMELDTSPTRKSVEYTSMGYKDPFRPLVGAGSGKISDGMPSLENLKLVGILEDWDINRALLEDAEGNGYILKPNDKIVGGYLVTVTESKAIFQVTEYGWTRTVALELAIPDIR
jgi:hypothetical protein